MTLSSKKPEELTQEEWEAVLDMRQKKHELGVWTSGFNTAVAEIADWVSSTDFEYYSSSTLADKIEAVFLKD